MTKLSWSKEEDRNFEYGIDRGVFYPKNSIGYAWSGLIAVRETTIDASENRIYIDGFGLLNHLLIGGFSADISAITYPEEFMPYDGYDDIRTGQGRRYFDLSYRTMQSDGDYKIHLVYNAVATPSDKNYSSLDGSVESTLFSWNLTTKSTLIPDAKASSHLVIDSKYTNPGALEAIEKIIYGDDTSTAYMPSITDLLAIFEEYAIFKVIELGSGIWRMVGPDDAFQNFGSHVWNVSYPSIKQLSDHLYNAKSL